MDLIKQMAEEYNTSSVGLLKPFNVREIARFVVSMNTDHTEDQKKLVCLFMAWKESVKKEMCG